MFPNYQTLVNPYGHIDISFFLFSSSGTQQNAGVKLYANTKACFMQA